MRNVYNKGRFRNREYAKHLRPFLKREGNKRWRKFAKNEMLGGLVSEKDMVNFSNEMQNRVPRKHKKTIKVKITKDLGRYGLSSSYCSYSSIRALNDSLRRNNIIRYTIY